LRCPRLLQSPQIKTQLPTKRRLSKEACQLRVRPPPLVKNLPKLSVCGSVGFIKCGLSTTDKTIRFYFQIIETLFPVWGIPCGSGPPGTLYAAIPKMGTERIHSDQSPVVRVYLGGRSLGVIFLCAGFSTQSSSFVSLSSPKLFDLRSLRRSLGAAGTVLQRRREASLKVEAAP
jgi:hypothetical protein